MNTVLVMGFGPFLDVSDNPAQRLALAVDGLHDGLRIVGRSMPVSYTRSVEVTLDAMADLDPVAVLGIGVARKRERAELEKVGRRQVCEIPDVDGCIGQLTGPDALPSSLPQPFVDALGCGVSDDAGTYVCNGWLHTVLQATGRPVGFLHIPPAGFPPEVLTSALQRAFGGLPPRPTEAP